jgi:hypothetical protein
MADDDVIKIDAKVHAKTAASAAFFIGSAIIRRRQFFDRRSSAFIAT